MLHISVPDYTGYWRTMNIHRLIAIRNRIHAFVGGLPYVVTLEGSLVFKLCFSVRMFITFSLQSSVQPISTFNYCFFSLVYSLVDIISTSCDRP